MWAGYGSRCFTSEEEMHKPAEDVGAHEEADARAQGQHRGPEERRKHLQEYSMLVVCFRESSPVEFRQGDI